MSSSSTQLELICLEDLVPLDHTYRRFSSVFDYSLIKVELSSAESDAAYKGFGILRLFKCLLLQFMEDVSDRELETLLQENVSAKWFCGFSLSEKTPDHTVFTRARSRIGTHTLSKIFSVLRAQLRMQGYMSEVFTFVDASHLIAKANLWKERDEAIKLKYDKLNNENVEMVANDKQARIGCKGQDKFWYGYKQHVSVDMQSGLINKVAVTPAHKTDAAGFKHVCPNQGAAYTDKGYCISPATTIAKAKGVHLVAIKKRNMKDKNRDLDRWVSGIRAPYERVFSKQSKRVRYVGIAKNQFAEFMKAICFNLRRLLVIEPPPLLQNTG